MTNNVSLISTLNAELVLTGGRVSLANLIDFSHFLDLYTLEETFYLSSDANIWLNPGDLFRDDPDCPIRILPESALNDAVKLIDEHTQYLYNAAPTNFTFSIGSYEYWTDAAARAEAANIGDDYVPMERTHLLSVSHNLHISVEKALESIATTRTTLIPSVRNLIPFLSVFHEFDTPAIRLYQQIADVHRVSVESVMSLVRPRSVYLPPLLSVLLNRCRTRDDLIPRLVELRAELREFRTATAAWFERLDQAETMRDKVEIGNELITATEHLTSRYASDRRIGIYKQLAGAVTDAAEDGSLGKMITKPTFALIKHAVAELAPEAISLRRFTGLVDILDEAFASPDQCRLLTSVFGNALDVSQRELTEAKKYRQLLRAEFDVSVPHPA